MVVASSSSSSSSSSSFGVRSIDARARRASRRRTLAHRASNADANASSSSSSSSTSSDDGNRNQSQTSTSSTTSSTRALFASLRERRQRNERQSSKADVKDESWAIDEARATLARARTRLRNASAEATEAGAEARTRTRSASEKATTTWGEKGRKQSDEEVSEEEATEDGKDDTEDAKEDGRLNANAVFTWFEGVSRALLRGDGENGTNAKDASDSNAIAIAKDASDSNAPSEDEGAIAKDDGRSERATSNWFRWAEGWNVSESVARATSGWIPTRNEFVSGDVSVVDSRGDVGVEGDAEGGASPPPIENTTTTETNVPEFMRRLPLPPWILQRMAGGDTLSSPENVDDQTSYDATATTAYVDDALRSANSTALNVTTAAVEKLNSALNAIEKVEENAVKEGRFDNKALAELRDALRIARVRAAEARRASLELEDAVKEVNRLKTSRARDGDADKERESALKEADDAVLRAVKSSNSAVAEASRQVAFVAKRADALGASASTQPLGADEAQAVGATTPPKPATPADAQTQQLSRRRRLMNAIASARESAADALVASELTQTVSKLTSWGSDLVSSRADKAINKGGFSPEELRAMVKPALQKVVANALDPTSDDDINAARVACSLSAWIYYLPQMQHALPRNRLRLITSSLDASEIIPTKQLVAGMALVEESNARALESINQAEAAARLAAQQDAAREIAAAKAATEAAQRAIEQLQLAAELCSNTDDESKKHRARETARAASELAREAQRRLEELRAVAENNKRMMEKMQMKRELAILEQQMQQTVVEQQRREEEARIRRERMENATLPVNFCVAAHDDSGTLWVVVEGSTNLASWQANLTFQPVMFEDESLNVTVHRGAYAAAKTMYGRIELAVKEHVLKHGARAKVRITGHSIGGSIAMIIGLMLLVRNGAPRYALADVWTFGAPYVLNGGDALLARFGLPRSFIRDVMMGDDVVPRSFSCYYPQWARAMLDSAPGPFKVDTKSSPSFLDEEMFYVPMGDVHMLQAIFGESHPLLPPGPGLYTLNGDGVYEMLASSSRDNSDEDQDDESWLHRRASTRWDDEVAADQEAITVRVRRKADSALAVHQLACLTQSDAALTASLIVSHIKEEDLLVNAGKMGNVLTERGRDAAQRVLLNTPHPLTILSNPGAYGDRGIISRHHNPFNYCKALSNARKMKPTRRDFVFPKNVVDGAPATTDT